MWYVHTMQYCPTIRKDEILPFVTTQMGLEIIMLSESEMSQKKLRTIVKEHVWVTIDMDTNVGAGGGMGGGGQRMEKLGQL